MDENIKEKQKNKKISSNVIFRNYGIIIKVIQIINIFNQIITNNVNNRFCFRLSYIILRIKGPGFNNILGNNFNKNSYPNEVYINGNKTDIINNSYCFNQIDNYVELKWYNPINNCLNMFRECSKITQLNLSNFNTSLVTIMTYMFFDCTSLINLDLTNFNTLNVIEMKFMFNNCSSLTSLNVSSFDTSNVITMRGLFYICSSLKSIELSNFNTSKSKDMAGMFYMCSKLETLNLSHFDTSQVTDMLDMFANCYLLKSLDLSNFITSKVILMVHMFYKCSSLTSLKISNFDTSEVLDMRSMFYNCSSLVSIKLSNFNTSKTNNMAEMFAFCSKLESLDLSHFDTSSITNLKHIFLYCSSLVSLNLSSFNTLNVENMEAMFENCSSLTYLDLSNFNTSKVTNMESMFSNCINIEYINLKNFNVSEVTNMNNIFFNIPENTVICVNSSDILFDIIISRCKNNYYIDSENNIYCLKNESVILSREEEKVYYEKVLEIMEESFKSENYDTSKIDGGQEEKIEAIKMTITFTSIQNEKNKLNINNNSPKIDFGECENLLRNDYNIPVNETLYLKKINLVQEGMKTSKVGYDVYCKLFGKNLIKLNLTSCKDSKISIFMPIEIDESLDKLNSSSGFYNDICYTTTSEDGTDITLNDRKKDFIDKNMSVCQEECQFSKYDKINNRAECVCNIKESSSLIDDLTFNKKNLLKNFKDIKNILNFNFLVCYKNLFNKNGILNNIGCYILLFIIFINLISIFIFYLNQFPLIKKKIKEIIYNTNEYKIINKKVNKYDPKNKQKSKGNKILVFKKNKKRKNNTICIKNKKSTNEKGTKNVIFKPDNNNNNNNKFKKNINVSMFIDEEINELSYDLAKRYDKRTFCQYYISLVKTKHNLICALFNNSDYNSTIIKIDLFLIGFSIDYVINALFYNDETMHKIYESKGYLI